MVVVPPSLFCDLLVTDRAKPLLAAPKREQLPPSCEGAFHLETYTGFKILFPGGIERICFSFDFYMSSNGSFFGDEKPFFPSSFLVAGKNPISGTLTDKVFILYPLDTFVWMSASSPLP